MWDMFNRYPYINLTDRNLDLLTKAIREMQGEVKNFVSINAVKYANPIQWSINRQYEKNTIVIDPLTGTAFISVQPVPNGIALTRTEYWTPVFDLSQFVTKAASNFANTYERDITTTATMATGAGDWVVWDSTLYVALNAIHVGDAYVVGGNIKRMTVEDFYELLTVAIHNLDEELDSEIRNRTNADTTLQHNIDAEASARESADDALQDNIDAEAQAREDADDTLQSNIDAEAQVREDADETLQSNIDAEAQAREDADRQLESQIVSASRGAMKSIFDYGYSAGDNITPYIQAFINDDSASELYLHMNGYFTIETLDLTPISGAIDKIKHFVKSANTHLSGDGAMQLALGTSEGESSEIRSMYSAGSDGYPHRFVRTSDTVHTPNGNTQINAMFIDNVLNDQDGFYHWNILGQSNIYSNTSGEDCVAYLQAHVYGDNENWALATENILHLNNERHHTRGIEVALTGAGDVSSNGGKRIGIHIVTNTTGGGFNADYGIFFSSHANNTGFKRLIEISNGYSEYVLKGEPNYTCVYGIDFADCQVNGAAIRVGKDGGHCIQFDSFVAVEENQLGVDVLSLRKGNNKLSITLNTSTNVTGIVNYLDVIYNGQTYKIPMYQ